jgi:hypothetical protein
MPCRIALLTILLFCVACGIIGPSADDLRNDPHGHLVWAARTGDVAAIRTLAARGVDLDASSLTKRTFVFPDIDHARWTALQHAAQKQHVEVVRTLLEWGADPDAMSPDSAATPLFLAAINDDRTTVRLLLDAGADVDWTVRRWGQPAPGGPLWHVIEHFMERFHGGRSPKDALELVRAAAAQTAP